MSVPLVLLVDDDALIRQIMKDALANVECTVVEAADGDEALNCIEKQNPHVVLLDLFMPKRSGLDVLKALAGRGNKSRIIVVSSMDTSALVDQAIALGAHGFLPKNPLHPLEVRSSVLGALGMRP